MVATRSLQRMRLVLTNSSLDCGIARLADCLYYSGVYEGLWVISFVFRTVRGWFCASFEIQEWQKWCFLILLW